MTTEPMTRSRLSRRVQDVPPSGIRKFFDVLATMPDVISLGVGEPDFDTPEVVVEAGIRSLREGRTHYTSNYGTIELRRARGRAPGSACTASTTTPTARSSSRVGVSEALAVAMTARRRPRRRGGAGRAVLRLVRAGHHLRRRRARLRAHAPRGWLAARPRGRRGGHHAAHQGALPGLSLQPHRRGARARHHARAGRRSPSATTCWSSATRSTTASSTAAIGTRPSAPCRA